MMMSSLERSVITSLVVNTLKWGLCFWDFSFPLKAQVERPTLVKDTTVFRIYFQRESIEKLMQSIAMRKGSFFRCSVFHDATMGKTPIGELGC
jgi:hypothetical protein